MNQLTSLLLNGLEKRKKMTDKSEIDKEKENILIKNGYKFNPEKKEWVKYSNFEVYKIYESFVKKSYLIELTIYIDCCENKIKIKE